MSRSSSNTVRQLALISTFTALYAIFRYIPTFPMYGLPGSHFRASDFLAPIYGILLGPWLAIPCIIIGTVMNYAISPPLYAGLDFLPGMVAAVVGGRLSRGERWSTAALYSALLALFLGLPLTVFWIPLNAFSNSLPKELNIPFAWLHILALLILISPIGGKSKQWNVQSPSSSALLGIGVTILAATMAQHLAGGILTELIRFPLIGITSQKSALFYWEGFFLLYPFERVIITVVSSTLTAAVLRSMRTAGYQDLLTRIVHSGSRVPGSL